MLCASHPLEGLAQAFFEECLCEFLIAAEAVRIGNQLLSLRHKHGREKIRVSKREAASKPNIKEIR